MLARYAVLLPILIALPANAGSSSSVTVSYKDLNLVSAKGQATLERRIDGAVRNVCDHSNSRDLAMRAASQKCQKAARSEALSKMQVAVQRAASNNELAGTGSSPKS